MKINSNLLRAAQVCVSKDILRPALVGIHISQKYVEATNGHVAIRMSHGVRLKTPVIINISGKIPARASVTDIRLKGEHIAVHYDENGLRVGISLISTITFHEFPNLDKVIPQAKDDELTPAFQVGYLAYLSKMFGTRYLHGAKFQFFGSRKPCCVRFSRKCREDYGNPLFILMPMRQHEGDYDD
ncbi:hypothetical protein F0T03_12790 [Yersinia canariae]|uniref:Uncharacterized protein n=1 Tax=Yersinia canariae TaxID=2607663 RepID=A0A857EZV1_9GAMM|nr:hypothetical protein [Yersinia canariae]QHB32957.1 hypothetical protein F0T03_12790 [Yersinia canariae]